MNFAHPEDTLRYQPPTDEEIREQLARILASHAFDAPERAQKFLSYVIEETLQGRADRIKAYSIAIEVFGRNESFDAQNDPVVRIEAGRVRRALEHYYLLGGQQDPILVTIPKGGYVPAFTRFHELKARLPEPVSHAVAPPSWRRDRMALATAAILVAGVGIWSFSGSWVSRSLSMGAPAVSGQGVPYMPRVIIAPFEDITGTQESNLVARGLTDEVIGQMARFKEITILAGEPPVGVGGASGNNVDLPVYRLEGRVRLDNDRLRFSARLVDYVSKAIIWTKAYDTELGKREILDIEMENAGEVATALAQPYGVIFQASALDMLNAPTADGKAYACTLSYYGYRADLNPQTHAAVQGCLKEIIADYPNYATAWALLSMTYVDELRFRYRLHPSEAPPLDLAVEAAERAAELDPGNVRALQAQMLADFFSGDVRNALLVGERAYAINPNDTEFAAEYGFRLALSGEWNRGCGMIAHSIEHNPGPMDYFQSAMAVCSYIRGNYMDAERWAHTSNLRDNPIYHLILIAIYAQRGKLLEAQLEQEWLERNAPEYLEDVHKEVAIRILRAQDQELFFDGLRKAGLDVSVRPVPRAEGSLANALPSRS